MPAGVEHTACSGSNSRNWGGLCFLNRVFRRKLTLELYFGKVSLMVSLNAKLKACVGLHKRHEVGALRFWSLIGLHAWFMYSNPQLMSAIRQHSGIRAHK